ncbi:hypothetical protein [Bacillus sp. AFS053548]|uniref:hypothetical protein n=1 Tax=Bacillus sp. AFS053548 TaxID=2033505 RepID=UPI000BFB80BF|nr:hypothetical protein [Bacillus sp. AFS053548]PGM56946.1 hypothetical protein CN946_08315 [Bacillus sp. AFS053548]
MKKLIILTATVLTMSIFTACEKIEALESKHASKPSTTEQTSPTNENGDDSMKVESTDILKKKPYEFLSHSKNFQVGAETYQSAEGRIEIDVSVSKAKTYMKNVIISGQLPINAYEVLYTPDLLITNILMKKSFSDKAVSKEYTISPSIKSPGGISAGRSFNLFPEETFEDAIAKLNEISIKVSWADKKDKSHTEYIKTKIQIKRPE